jgi:hypothetical protein
MSVALVGFIDDLVESTTRVFKPIKKHLKSAGFSVTSKICEDTEVLILSLDGDESKEWVQTNHIPEDVYKIFIVHEVSLNTSPFLKYADKLIFFNDLQRGVATDILKVKSDYMVVPYPLYKKPKKDEEKSQAVFFSTDYDPDFDDKYYNIFKTWWDPEKYVDTGDSEEVIKEKMESDFRCYFSVEPPYEQQFLELEKRIMSLEKSHLIKIRHSPRWRDKKMIEYMSRCKYAYLWSEEMPIGQAKDLIQNKSTQAIYTPFRESSLLSKAESFGCKIIVDDGISMYNESADRVSDEKFAEIIIEDFTENKDKVISKKSDLSSVPVDTLGNLNVVSGGVVTTPYVFVVSFRNQKEKILRCLESISSQIYDKPFSIVVTDDCSNDGSSEIVLEFLNKTKLPHAFVLNKERKHASRNLWNAVNLLVGSNKSVIIEVDGDDYLYGNNVLPILSKAYSEGAIKTLGSFITIPENKEMEERAHGSQSYYNAWDQGTCSSWCPLRTYKKSLFNKVELMHFLDRENNTWLEKCHDSSVNSRMIQIAGTKTRFIEDILYVYDLSGEYHDSDQEEEWSPVWAYNHINGPISF